LGNIWIATENGLNYFRPQTNKWSIFNDEEGNKNSLPSRQVFDIKIRRNGEVWLATSNLICRYDPISGTFENRNNNPKIEALYHAFYTTLYEDHDNNMWLSTARSGIYMVDDHFNLLKSYRKSGGFKANMVHQFVEDSAGTLWMASDLGIYYKNKGEDQIRKVNSDDDIINGDIKSIQLESNSKIWVSTLNGLVYLKLNEDKSIQAIRVFTDKDGLQSKAFNTFAGAKMKSGEFFFGGINGFNIFNPASIKYNSVIPSVKLVGLKVQNQERHPTKKEDNQYFLELNYDQNDFSFEMASLSYDIIDNNLYKYQLIGYDKEINFSGTNRFAQYTNVPPGKYQLKVMGSNNDGLWNEEGYILNLVIHPPFWKTLWFRIFMVLTIGLSGYVIYSWRINSIRKQVKLKSDIEKKIAEARSVALRAQMNPHFIFNSLNSIQHLISESEKADAHKYLSKFSKLMRLVLENSSKNVNTVESETEMLRLYLDMEILRFENKFSYEIQIDKEPSILNVEIPSMLLHPFVENAVIHGLLKKTKPGHLSISLERKNSSIICIIEDDGIGRNAAEEIKNKKLDSHKSRGLQVTEDRIKMIETITQKRAQIKIVDLVDADGLSTGTRVIIEIPIESQT
jgi:two-component sensor histidine kinase